MIQWFRQLDELLRGDRVRGDRLAAGNVQLSLRVFMTIGILLGASYGFFMGWYALGVHGPEGLKQLLSATLKLPLLFLLTLGVTFPSLYVFNALVGCRLTFTATLRLLVAAIVVNLAVGASLGPILGFFTLSTRSYSFMVVLNILLLGLAGAVGLAFLLKTLRDLAREQARIELAAARPVHRSSAPHAADDSSVPRIRTRNRVPTRASRSHPPDCARGSASTHAPSRIQRPAHLPRLGHHLRDRRCADGLGAPPVRRRSRTTLRDLPCPRWKLRFRCDGIRQATDGRQAVILSSLARHLHREVESITAESARPAIRPSPIPRLILLAVCGGIFGAVLGSHDALGQGRWVLPIFAAIKLPLMVAITTVLCLPGFWVLSTIIGLRSDLRDALRAILAGQTAQALTLASLAPVQAFAYVSGIDHAEAILFAGVMLAIATALGLLVMRRRYQHLIHRNPRHRLMLAYWLLAYVFVGIQLGWMFRPFVGSPGLQPSFFRQEPFSNAYIALAKIVEQVVR